MAHLAMNIVSNGGGSDGHMTTAAATSAVDPAAVVALHNDIAELKNRLAARDRHVRQLEDAAEASEDVVAEWQGGNTMAQKSLGVNFRRFLDHF